MMYSYGNTVSRILPKLVNGAVNPEAIAQAFILKVEEISAQAMGSRQSNAVYAFANMLSGIGTTNGSDLLTKMVNHGTKMFIYCPIDDATWSFDVYAREFLSGGEDFGTFENFVLADGNDLGVLGGTLKYFNSGARPIDYPQDNVGYYAYSHGANTSFRALFGSTNASGNGVSLVCQTTDRLRLQINTAYSASYITTPSLTNFIGGVRSNPTNKRFYKIGGLVFDTTNFGSSSNHLDQDIYFFANNLNGSPDGYITTRLSFMLAGTPAFTDDENLDLYEAVQTFVTDKRP